MKGPQLTDAPSICGTSIAKLVRKLWNFSYKCETFDLSSDHSNFVPPWFLPSANPLAAHIYKDQTITDECRCAEITPRLQQCCPYDWSYRRVFACVIEDLEVLDKAARALVKFLSLICAEGNVILCDGPAYLRASDEKTTCNDETAPVFSTSSVDKDLPWSPNDASSLVNLIDPTLSPYEASPTWKLKLAHKYPIEQLYVGATELQVFAQTLGYARLARKEVVDTTRLIKKVAALADDMQEVFDMWSERCKGSETKEMGEAECVILEELIFRKAGWAR